METFGLAPPREPDAPPYSCALLCDGQPTIREGTQDRCKEIGPNTWETFDYNPNTKEWHPGGQGPVGGTTCRVETGPADPTLPIFRTIYPAGHPKCAAMAGEPHARTFDGVRYDLQAAGEFVAVTSRGDDLEVQLRLEAVSDGVQASAVTAAAARVGTHRVTIAARADGPLRIDGVAVPLGPDEYGELEGGGAVVRTGSRYSIVWPDGTNLHVDLFRRHVNVYALASEARDGRLTGLLGDADGDAGANDFRTQDGRVLASPPDFDDLYKVFADSWRVRPERSLFDYEAGQDTGTFTNRAFPSRAVGLADLGAGARAKAETRCREAGIADADALEHCVYDVALTGDDEYVASALSNQTPSAFRGNPGPASELVSATAEGITLRVPREVVAAFPVAVQVSGTLLPGDMVALARTGTVDANRLTAARVYTVDEGGTLQLVGRNEPGTYEVRYLTEASSWRQATVRLAFESRAPMARLEAPETARAGGVVDVRCIGECSPLAYITIVPAGSRDDVLGAYAEMSEGTAVTVRGLPAESGEYEVRYLAPRNPRRVFARAPIRLQ